MTTHNSRRSMIMRITNSHKTHIPINWFIESNILSSLKLAKCSVVCINHHEHWIRHLHEIIVTVYCCLQHPYIVHFICIETFVSLLFLRQHIYQQFKGWNRIRSVIRNEVENLLGAFELIFNIMSEFIEHVLLNRNERLI